MNNNHVYDMLVVGGGPGGYTAALYAARAGLDTVVLEKLSAGGQMALTEQIDNYPGFENGIDGFSLAENMQKQAERFGARSEYADSLVVGKINIDEEPRLAGAEGIAVIPTLVLYRNGKAVDSVTAPGSKAEIDRFIQEALAK